VGARPERELRFGRKDNFWQMAETGPCGPNSEINYYLGEHPENPEYNRADLVNGPHGDTTMEIWNLVFMQYNRIEVEPGKYKLEPLPKPSVDTGLGLERTAVILQGKFSNYDTDLIRPIVDFTANLARRDYELESQEGFAMRVIADHARATAFLIADGILPGNEGRNYVLRKIMRRAIYQGRHALGFKEQFFYKVTDFVVDQMHEPYPELEAQRDFIEKMVRLEEERFGATLTAGLNKLDELISASRDPKTDEVIVPTLELARLYDTFGTPIDLMYVILSQGNHKLVHRVRPFDHEDLRPVYFIVGIESVTEEDFGKGIGKLTEENFRKKIEDQLKDLQKSDTEKQTAGSKRLKPVYVALARRHDTKSGFRGYETTKVDDAKIVALIRGDDEVQALNAGDEAEVVLNHTPFYAESGGQVGDVGRLSIPHATAGGTDLIATVLDTYSPAQGLIVHKVKVEKGTLKIGDTVVAEVDVEKRNATRRNHTATHLMHAALREVLGTHVKQAGSVVAPNYLRFDFTHYQPLTQSEIEEIERLVNYHILRNEPVQTEEMAVEEAMRSGAMALFGEKYGEKVRVLSIKGAGGGADIFSKELCGGTHVRATGDIGLFKMLGDESIASGVRRIRAVTGVDAFERFRETEAIVDRVTADLRTSRSELPAVISKLQDELKKARREADELRMKIATGAVGSSSSNGDESREVAGVRVLAREASGLDAAAMRQLSDTLLARIKSGVVVLGRSGDGKVSLIVRTSSDLTGKVPAGQVIKELAPIVGGKGGGKADMAEGGGNQPEKLEAALKESYQVIERLITKASGA
jgi:alanyl-tRNA synthetase